MKVVTIGGGPAGLYFALLLRKADPSHEVTVLERNGPDDAYGWGVVFSAQTLDNFRLADPPTYDEIVRHFARWDDIDVHVRGRTITSGGHGFAGIARRTLLGILQRRAAELGVELRFHQPVDEPAIERLRGEADLLVGADGVNSAVRRRWADVFQPDVDVRPARYVWLGTSRPFDAFTFCFVERGEGVYQAHAYQFAEGRSAFIVECDERSWRLAGFDRLDLDATVAVCERLFAPWLDGHPLLANTPPHLRAAPWLRFSRVSTARWHHENVVLLGDAAHTAHFSIGSGTKLAMEDGIGLAKQLSALGARRPADDRRASQVERRTSDGTAGADRPAPSVERAPLTDALAAYEADRRTEALRLQNAARNSMEWFENVRRYLRLEPEQFAYSLLTRSQRVGHENLRLRDAAYLGEVERWFAGRASGDGAAGGARGAPPDSHDRAGIAAARHRTDAADGDRPPPPMFTPFTMRGLTVENRVVVSPMDMYSADDGTPNDFHLVHYGARALGGAGLVVTEMTCVSPEARISLGCTGMYRPEHVAAWRRVTEMVHRWSRAKICLQLGHSGAKGSTRRMWEGNEQPLPDGNWEVVAPSAVAFRPGMQVPREITRAEMARVRDDFARATAMGVEAGFDMVELHCAHGYLLSAFITPLGNRRQDEYGGCLENRLRFPLEVLAAMRAVLPDGMPASVRISATDWVEGGVDGAEAVEIARRFHAAGADVVHVSAGQTSAEARPVYGRMFQTPLSDRVRNEGGVPTIAVGNITEPDQVNGIIAAGRADLCALARPHLVDPQWTLRAAAELGWPHAAWPVQYLSGKEQLERTLRRQRELELLGTSTI